MARREYGPLIISILAAASLYAEDWPCQEYVDADYIRDARLIALVSPEGPEFRTLNIQQVYRSDLSREEHLDFKFEYEINRERIWSDVADALAHNRDGFLDRRYYAGAIDPQGYDSCNFNVRLTPGVTYLLIQGEQLRYRSIEPILDVENDEWLSFVLSVLRLD